MEIIFIDAFFMKGKIGTVEVLLTRENIQGLQANVFTNCYEGELSDGTMFRIESG